MSWSNNKTSVLVPFDFSDACFEAIEVARSFVASDAAITVMHVVAPPTPSYPELLWADTNSESIRAKVHTAVADRIASADIGAQVVTRVGSPATEVGEYAKNAGIEMIVLPSRGRTGIGRWLLGSVAEGIVRHASVPVLVLRRDKKD